MLIDGCRRTIDYLRLSVTDRCNLRCVYCLPESFARFSSSQEALSDDEHVELVTCFARAGITKLRLTGGEPLVRAGLPGLVERLARVPGIADVSLSTNGIRLAGVARELKKAGLKRVNISLDSLDSGRFARITRYGTLDGVLAGVDAALDAGLDPVKINVVVARSMNDDELGDFARLTEDRPVHVRFIELMPMGETGFFSKERWVPLDEMMAKAAPLEPVAPHDRPAGHGPARYYRRPGARGTVGFISALSCGFCASCNRIRLSASGVLVPCLDAVDGVDLRTPLRQGLSRPRLEALIRDAVHKKPESHVMNARAAGSAVNPRYMCSIGG